MASRPLSRSTDALDALAREHAGGVVAQALSLQRLTLAGAVAPLLRGKNFGLLCDDEANAADAALFRRAATELGAHVAHIRASLSERSSVQEVEHTAHMLGRLYDAIECEGMPAALVRQVGRAVDMPVYDGIASPNHPTAALADHLGAESPLVDRRRFIVQAVLLASLA
jgi:ornithine carbamoyltransferase